MWQDNVFTPVILSTGGGCLLHTPHGQTPLQAHTHTLGRHPPPSASWDTVNKWAVHILLECILVFHINLRTSNFNEWVIIQCIRRFIIQCIRRFIIQFISVYHSVYLIVYHLVYLTVYHSVYLSLSYGLSHLVYLTVCHEVYHSVIPQFITGRNEVVAKVMFLHVSVILSTGGGLQGEAPWTGRPPDQADPPWAGKPPPGPGRPPQTGQTPRAGRTPPGPCRPPPGSRLQNTVYERPVRLLLECILVMWAFIHIMSQFVIWFIIRFIFRFIVSFISQLSTGLSNEGERCGYIMMIKRERSKLCNT